MFPVEFQVETSKTRVKLCLDLSELQKQIMEQLNDLDEIRQDAIQRANTVQQQRSRWHEKYIKERKFQPGDWELLFD